MKIIFLDVDGVLINRAACRAGFGKVDPVCIAVLNKLLADSGAFIVVSSCWRMGKTVLELRDLFNDWGVTPGRILDRTGRSNDVRGVEIQEWLDQREKHRGDVESFVIVDDDSDMAHLLHRHVKTSMATGLTEEHAELVKKLFA